MQLNALLKPLKLSAAISLVGLLAACSGNSSSTVSGPAPVIAPIEINKEITEVEWTAENYVTNASHAYRVITKSSMLRLVFTNQLAAFDALVNLLRVDADRDCNISGRMVAEQLGDICYEIEGGDPTPCESDWLIKENTQKSQGIACQDGTVAGQYFDGFFNSTARTDFTDLTKNKTSTIISAVDSAPTFDQDGLPILDEDDDPILKDFTDYLFQSDISTFFFDHEYESYVDFSTTDLDCNGTKYQRVEQQGMRSSEVGTQEGDGINNFYLYTKFTDMDLKSIPVETCGDDDKQVVTYTYNFSAKTMANAAMGGGTNRNTEVTWSDMDISLKGEPSGTLTLEHQNTDVDTMTVTVEFRNDGFVSVQRGAETPEVLPLADFLALSEPVVAEPTE
ncbi:MAG: hypothetical protein JKY50_11320 [Oleispira sp.]|nr:hypothetical protein [Oleispira sp.]MBL4881312.1 hypothetical protein [Oleispira sp.]